MNRVHCINCQTTWPTLPLEQLEQPHTCPTCGDELTPVIVGREADGTVPAPIVYLPRAA